DNYRCDQRGARGHGRSIPRARRDHRAAAGAGGAAAGARVRGGGPDTPAEAGGRAVRVGREGAGGAQDGDRGHPVGRVVLVARGDARRGGAPLLRGRQGHVRLLAGPFHRPGGAGGSAPQADQRGDHVGRLQSGRGKGGWHPRGRPGLHVAGARQPLPHAALARPTVRLRRGGAVADRGPQDQGAGHRFVGVRGARAARQGVPAAQPLLPQGPGSDDDRVHAQPGRHPPRSVLLHRHAAADQGLGRLPHPRRGAGAHRRHAGEAAGAV
ncbi:MAG: hypothetical protein AVDCRST_MAG77-1910, partial [uncultured Chloroflexi bacterium]